MNPQKYDIWRQHAEEALSSHYTYEQACIVLEWFDNATIFSHRELVGDSITGCLQVIAENDKHFSLHNNMMMRMWLYAPYILAKGE